MKEGLAAVVEVAAAANAVNEIASELASGSSQQAASVVEITAAMEELARTASQIAENAATQAELAQRAEESGNIGKAAVEEAVQGIEEARKRGFDLKWKFRRLDAPAPAATSSAGPAAPPNTALMALMVSPAMARTMLLAHCRPWRSANWPVGGEGWRRLMDPARDVARSLAADGAYARMYRRLAAVLRRDHQGLVDADQLLTLPVAEQHADWDHEHVDDRMLKPLREEQHRRSPDRE